MKILETSFCNYKINLMKNKNNMMKLLYSKNNKILIIKIRCICMKKNV
jgi:hypothetical protein